MLFIFFLYTMFKILYETWETPKNNNGEANIQNSQLSSWEK